MDIAYQSLSAGHWIALGASAQGAHHLQEGLPCQDAFGFRLVGDATLILAVADGLGSAPRSATGASLAVATTLDWIEAQLTLTIPTQPAGWETLVLEAFMEARAGLEQEAALESLAISELATTLLIAAVTPDLLVTGQVGDGAIVAMEQDGPLLTISPPQNGEYINETFSITSPHPEDYAQIVITPLKVDGLALFSDGMQRLALHLQDLSPHPPFFLPLFQQLAGIQNGTEASITLANFLSSERVNALTSDDKTLVLAKYTGPAITPRDEPG